MSLEFKKIEIGDVKIMTPYYSMRKNITCDSVFLESFVWKDFYNVRYAVWEDKAILWLMEYNGRCFSAMPLCREEDLPGAFHAIEQYFNEELDYPLVINLADEYAVEYLKLPENQYFVEEQVDARDYLYTGESLRTLSGKKLHKKKNHLNAFMRRYEGRYEYRALCCSDSHYVWQFLDHWREQKGEDVEEHLDSEVKGIHDILKNCSDLNIRMGGVFIDGRLEAFTMGSYNPVENMAVIHIEKANAEINGLYQFINRQFLAEEFPEVEWVNREDDLGIEGLRKAKMSYNPVDFARKYLVEQIRDGKKGFKWAEEIGNTTRSEELLYLEAEDKQETRRLWHDCFPEDSEEFTDYYYSEKLKDNRILIKKQNGFLVAMAQMNPYTVRVKDRTWDIHYIVGVATQERHRHQGHMSEILKKLMKDLWEEKAPFTFLMPAAREIYLPFGFEVIARMMDKSLTSAAAASLRREPCRETEDDILMAARWMESWLKERYQVYCERTKGYVKRLLPELRSENGTLEFLYDEGRLVGLQADWGRKEREQRLLYAEEEYLERAVREGALIMARVMNLEAMLSAFSLKEPEGEEMIYLHAEDPLISGNAGLWRWTLTGTGSCLEQVGGAKEHGAGEEENQAESEEHNADSEEQLVTAAELTAPVWKVSVGQLAPWLFGFKEAEELWPDLNQDLLTRLKKIDTVKAGGVLIDEAV